MDNVALVGGGPAAQAVTAAFEDVDGTVSSLGEPDFAEASLAVVVGHAGEDVFERADESAREHGTPWLAVELGGVGGYPLVEASVAGFDPNGACYGCLQSRVAANAPADADPVSAPEPSTARFAGAMAGRSATALLDPSAVAPATESPLGHVIELPHRRRRVLPVPHCDCDGDRSRTLERTGVDRDLEEALARAEQGLDDRVGVVTQVGEGESYPAAYYLAQLAETGGFSDASAPAQAAGVAGGWDEAFMKALGEAYERYAAAVYREDAFTVGPASAIEDAVSPTAFVGPDDYEVDDETELGWVPGESLADGSSVHLPASLVVHPPPDRPIRPAITTGLGLGSSGADALISGLTEVIERDATMLAWYSTYDPLELTVADEAFESLAARAGAEGLSVTPLLVTQDVDVPVIAVAVHRETFPRFAIGSAAHLDPARAARGALTEAIQNWMELRSMGEDGASEANGAIGMYATDPEPAGAWLDADGPVSASSVGSDSVPTGEAAVDLLTERLADADCSAYAVGTTTRDLETMGFEAVRVLVPEAQPLFLGDPFFGERAQRVPGDLGFEPHLDAPPHPFP